MAHESGRSPSADEGKISESEPKRRRLTGTSRWTQNSISRQIAERQADVDVDDMISRQLISESSMSDTAPLSNHATCLYAAEYLENSPLFVVKKNFTVSIKGLHYSISFELK
jgi:hypothetical protein